MTLFYTSDDNDKIITPPLLHSDQPVVFQYHCPWLFSQTLSTLISFGSELLCDLFYSPFLQIKTKLSNQVDTEKTMNFTAVYEQYHEYAYAETPMNITNHVYAAIQTNSHDLANDAQEGKKLSTTAVDNRDLREILTRMGEFEFVQYLNFRADKGKALSRSQMRLKIKEILMRRVEAQKNLFSWYRIKFTNAEKINLLQRTTNTYQVMNILLISSVKSRIVFC